MAIDAATVRKVAHLISTHDLAQRLGDPRLKIIDASWRLDGSDARGPFIQARIPGAVFFDIDVIADPDSPLPHMLPTPEGFAEAVSSLGIGSDDEVVVYDQAGLFSAPRVWWTFRVFGHDRVRVLDGGLPKWLAEGRPAESGSRAPASPARFTSDFRPDLVRSADQILPDVAGGRQLVDARPAARFRGEAPEPRPGLRGGHVPGAWTLPFPEVLNADGTLKSREDLAKVFEAAGIDVSGRITTTCGSGLTAAILALAAARAGNPDVAVYDGSWAEWGASDGPIMTGAA